MTDVYAVALETAVSRISTKLAQSASEPSLRTSLTDLFDIQKRYTKAAQTVSDERGSAAVKNLQQSLLELERSLDQVKTSCISAGACLRSPMPAAIIKAEDNLSIMNRRIAEMDKIKSEVQTQLSNLSSLASAVSTLRVVELEVRHTCQAQGIEIDLNNGPRALEQ